MIILVYVCKALYNWVGGVQAAAVHHGSVCMARRNPSGHGWALDHRHDRIRDKLRAQFGSVEECFAMLDEDRSGTLNRRELAVGLAKVSGKDESDESYLLYCG